MISPRALLRPVLWLLLFAALTGRVAAMPGWMPVAGAHGIEIALCAGGTMVMPMAMHGQHGMPAKHRMNDCPYAAAAHVGGFVAAADFGVSVLRSAHDVPATPSRSIVAGRALALPPATGPPVRG